MNSNAAVKKRINELCKERKISYSYLSKKAGLNETTLPIFMSGNDEQALSIPSIFKICRFLDITLEIFFDKDYFENVDEFSFSEKE